MTSPARSIQRKLDIALALAGRLLPKELHEALDKLVQTNSHRHFKAQREDTLSKIKEAILLAQEERRRCDALHAFRALLLEGVFIDSMAVLAVESRIAEFNASNTPPAPATVSEHEQP